MSDNLEFGEFITERRKHHEYTMRQFAGMICVTAPYLSNIEKVRRAAPNSKHEDIAVALRALLVLSVSACLTWLL
ncbi:helix-turn-helix domain-containing protein [Gleimia sp. 6138-11-ORH1]|uniref:helix-turn-helix domain-containing protein n=1 Tax=Gleimia sp. 6138-11-ORH1 TaxID=2973937 RepID=UPI002166F185|nr:helix-turn-helix domain-containing protein [Gleimia sp. 6138-11-ORH1]MCS4484002.1 helix-turn-helix domain-containing protein [Gleimia sp. 6138-11-ORH1]